MGVVGELFLPGSEDDEDSLGLDATAQECQEAQAQLVRPVQIFEHDEQRLAGRKLLQELSDAFEEPPVVDLFGRPGCAGHGGELGQ